MGSHACIPRPSLYVHVPFCVTRCSYCDFHSGPLSGGRPEAWLSAVASHLETLARRFGVEGFKTAYIGGGTPSCLPADTMAGLMALVGGFGGAKPDEWTMEANPEDLSPALIHALAGAGPDRLSLGVQSLEPDARRVSGRRGSADDARASLELAAANWSGRLSADLIYGLPGQTADGLAKDIGYLAGLGIGHLSLYELTLSEGVPMAIMARNGACALPGDDERDDMYRSAKEAMAGAGFARYEVSNWSRDGQECAHNAAYWAMGDWLGIGPSASGNVGMADAYLRMDNVADDAAYCADPAGSSAETLIAGRTAAFETVMMALRTAKGLNRGDFSRRFGADALAGVERACAGFPEEIRRDGPWIRPSDLGMDMLNRVLLACMRELDT